jgi:L-ascorbate metabolism protein UlaG (beta-lactamase superfamily)
VTRLTLIGGPTLLIEHAGLRLLTDPTFDVPGNYASGALTLTKLAGPALEPAELGRIDAVLLSHDQHADNLDPAGRRFLASVPLCYTTASGAARLEGPVRGLRPWETISLGDGLSLTATPARHGPAGIEPISGDVTGFVVQRAGSEEALYVSGDTVFFEGISEVARRFRPSIAVIFAGAAQTRGPFDLTMNTNDALDTAFIFPDARIVPVHTEGWAHFTQGFRDLELAFAALGRADRLVHLQPGTAAEL